MSEQAHIHIVGPVTMRDLRFCYEGNTLIIEPRRGDEKIIDRGFGAATPEHMVDDYSEPAEPPPGKVMCSGLDPTQPSLRTPEPAAGTRLICPACGERNVAPDDPGHANGCPYTEIARLRKEVEEAGKVSNWPWAWKEMDRLRKERDDECDRREYSMREVSQFRIRTESAERERGALRAALEIVKTITHDTWGAQHAIRVACMTLAAEPEES